MAKIAAEQGSALRSAHSEYHAAKERLMYPVKPLDMNRFNQEAFVRAFADYLVAEEKYLSLLQRIVDRLIEE